MTENAKAEFGIFVQNLALGYIVGKRARDEYLVFERIAQQFADFLAPRRAWILIQDTVTVSGKLFERMHHRWSSSLGSCGVAAGLPKVTTNRRTAISKDRVTVLQQSIRTSGHTIAIGTTRP
jgi:hypothetical protein